MKLLTLIPKQTNDSKSDFYTLCYTMYPCRVWNKKQIKKSDLDDIFKHTETS